MGDIIENGVLLTGGGAKTAHLKEMLQKQLDLDVHIARSPDCTIITGAGVALEKMYPSRRPEEKPRVAEAN